MYTLSILGPAVLTINNLKVLVGTTSFGNFNLISGCNENTDSYYMNIFWFRDWIKKNMEGIRLSNCLIKASKLFLIDM